MLQIRGVLCGVYNLPRSAAAWLPRGESGQTNDTLAWFSTVHRLGQLVSCSSSCSSCSCSFCIHSVTPSPPIDISELWWLSGGKGGILSELLRAVFCMTVYTHGQFLNLYLFRFSLEFCVFL